MGAWVGRVNCFYISWKRSFHSPVELDLTPTWPILWSSDRVTAPQPATHLTFFRTNSSSLWTIGAIGDETTTLVLHHLIIVPIGSEKQPDRAEHRYHFQQNIPTVQFPHSCCTFFLSELSHLSQLVAGRVAACFDSGRQRQALVLQNMFSQKALLTQVIQSIQCQSWERLAIQGRAQIWIENMATCTAYGFVRWIQNFPLLGGIRDGIPLYRQRRKFGTIPRAQGARHKMNLKCQLNSLCELVFNMFAWILNRKSRSKVNSTIRMFNSSKAVFKVNFEKVSQGTILF